MIHTNAGASQQQQQQQYHQHAGYDQHHQYKSDYNHNPGGGGDYEHRDSEEYEDGHTQTGSDQYSREAAQARANGIMGGGGHQKSAVDGRGSGSGGYSVAGTHDYLGYPKDQQPFGGDSGGLWDDEKEQDLW